MDLMLPFVSVDIAVDVDAGLVVFVGVLMFLVVGLPRNSRR